MFRSYFTVAIRNLFKRKISTGVQTIGPAGLAGPAGRTKTMSAGGH